MIQVKKIELDQIDRLMEWRMEVIKEVFKDSNYDREQMVRANERYYQETIPYGEHIAVFAYLDEKIVGCGGLCFQREMPSPDDPSGHTAYLMNIYTFPAFRQQGVGTKIVSFLIDEAKKRQITKITLEASQKGIPLYRSLGFVEEKDMMILDWRKYEKAAN